MIFQKPKGQRLYKRFIWITNFNNLWYVESIRKWILTPPIDGDYSNCVSCKTIRAFRRHLRKHPEIKGKAVLVSRFKGYDVFA